MTIWLLVSTPPEKYEFVNGKDDIPYIMKNKKCLKPPISYNSWWVYNTSYCYFSVIVIMIISGWWYTYPFEKYEFASWDDEIPNWMEK